jgi:hypothetical protein
MNFLYLIIGGLATFRISLLVSKEDGPAFIFRKIRRMPPKKSSAHEGLSCPWCVSVWASAIVTTFYWWTSIITGVEWPLHWLAISALGIIINQQWTKGT